MKKFILFLLAAVLTLGCAVPMYARKPKLSPEARAAQKRAKAQQKALKKHTKAQRKAQKRRNASH